MLTKNEKLKSLRQTQETQNNIVTEQTFGNRNHKEIASGQSDTSSKFSSLQIIGNPTTPDTATITYTSIGIDGSEYTKENLVAYVGDTIYGHKIINVTHSSGDAVIRAYYA